jgi:hypothetical protein
LPTEDLLVSRARIKAEKSAGAANGRIVVKGEFVVPPFFSSPPAFTVRIEDSSTLDTAHTFQDCDTSGNVQKARCRDRVAEGDFGVVLKARKNSNVIRVKVVFKRLSVSAPLAAPVTVSLLHNSAVVRADAIGNCKAKPGKLSCKQ